MIRGSRLMGVPIVLAIAVALIAAGVGAPGGGSTARAADRDCSDFSNQAAAQSYFISKGGPSSDPDRLDADHDGVACEALPCPCSHSTGGGGGSPTPTAPTCGKERWAVKTLSDSRVRRVNFTPKVTSVDALRTLSAPHVRFSTPRQLHTAEVHTYKLKAQLVEFKREKDHDVHLVIADPSDVSHTMIVEFPDPKCRAVRSSSKRRAMARARTALLDKFGTPSSTHFEKITGTATITGVGFFDVLHGQRGVAPNGIELHPVLSFR